MTSQCINVGTPNAKRQKGENTVRTVLTTGLTKAQNQGKEDER